jgi:hypothetical protein
MVIAGVLTQSQSCGNKCSSEGNTPLQDWGQLMTELDAYPATSLIIRPWLTDMANLVVVEG